MRGTAAAEARVGRGAVQALAAALLFGVNGTVSKLVLSAGLVAGELMALRVSGAALVLVALLALRRPRALAIGWRELPAMAAYGLIGVSIVQWTYFVAIGRLPVGIALLIEFTAPLLVALWVRFVRREAVRRRIWVAVAASLAGLALVGRVGPGQALDRVGLVAASGAAVALAAYLLMSERALAGRDPESLAAWGFAVSSLVWLVLHPWWTFPFGVLAERVSAPPLLPAPGLPVGALVAWVVLGGTVAPFLLTLRAIRNAGATRIALVGTSEPVIAGAIAWALLGEALVPTQLVGVVVVLAGIVLAVTARTGRAEPAAGAGAVADGPTDVAPPEHDARDARGVPGAAGRQGDR